MTRASGVSYYLNDEETLLVGIVREFIDREVKPTVQEMERANEYPDELARGGMSLSGAMGGL